MGFRSEQWIKLMSKIKIIINPLHYKESTDRGLHTHNLIISNQSRRQFKLFVILSENPYSLIGKQGWFDGKGSLGCHK